MATSTSPTAGSGIANPNQTTLNDYYQAGHQAPSGPSSAPSFCKLDGLKAIQGKGCSGGGNRLLQTTVYSLVKTGNGGNGGKSCAWSLFCFIGDKGARNS